MFLTGNWMGNHGPWIERMIEAGHELGSHSVSHPHLNELETDGVVKQIEPTVQRMLDNHGYRIHVFRPPYGGTNPKINTISRFYGMEVIMWGLTSKDANDAWTSEAIKKLLLKEIEPGDIVLCHNGAKYLQEFLIPVLDELVARGYTFCTVSELMGWTWDDTYTNREARIAAGETFGGNS
jgi:peptidoglycan/xylan/chitin deacetylase (PgdA/CDA1 family)